MNKALANTLFGMGAAALLLTNKPSLARQAKYKLLHSVRVCSCYTARQGVLHCGSIAARHAMHCARLSQTHKCMKPD